MKRAIIIAAMLAAAGLAGAQMFAQLFGTTSRLPAGYLECNWIESSGTQYINTGVYPTLKDTDFDVTVSSMAYNNRLFGISQNIGGTIYRYRGYCGSAGGIINMFVGTASTTSPAITNSAIRFRTTGGVFRINDNVADSWTGTNAVLTVPFLLCAEHDGFARTANVRLFSAKLSHAGSPIRDFVPCLNASNVPGVYDLVGATFYPNAGTGSFDYELK